MIIDALGGIMICFTENFKAHKFFPGMLITFNGNNIYFIIAVEKLPILIGQTTMYVMSSLLTHDSLHIKAHLYLTDMILES